MFQGLSKPQQKGEEREDILRRSLEDSTGIGLNPFLVVETPHLREDNEEEESKRRKRISLILKGEGEKVMGRKKEKEIEIGNCCKERMREREELFFI